MKHSARIQRYLDGKMKGEELKKFRDDLQKDPELVQELDLHRSVGEIIVAQDEERFRKKLQNAYKEYKILTSGTQSNSDKKSVFNIFRKAAVYLPVAALIGFLIFFQWNRKVSNNKIFNDYFAVYDIDIINRENSSSEEENIGLDNGKELYRQANYSDASRQFNLVLVKNPGNTEARFFNGLCYIYLNQFDDAIASFDYVISQPFNYYQEYSEWYLALSYIRTNQNDLAKTILKEIIKKKGFFSDSAARVLKKLH